MFLIVPSLSKAKKVAFERIKMATGVKQAIIYPVTDNLVYVFTGKVDKDSLKPAVALKKLTEKGEKFLFITETLNGIQVIEPKDDGEIVIFHYEKAVQPLLAHLLRKTDKEIRIFVLETEKDLISLIEEAKKEVLEVMPDKKIDVIVAEVKVTDEDLKRVIREISLLEKVKQQLEEKTKNLETKKVAMVLLTLLLIGGGYYGYKWYGHKEKTPVKTSKKVQDFSKLNSRIAGFLLINLDKIGFAVIENNESYVEFEKRIENLPLRYMGYYYVYDGEISQIPKIVLKGSKKRIKPGFYPAIDRKKVEEILKAVAGEKRKIKKLIVQKIKGNIYSVDIEI